MNRSDTNISVVIESRNVHKVRFVSIILSVKQALTLLYSLHYLLVTLIYPFLILSCLCLIHRLVPSLCISL